MAIFKSVTLTNEEASPKVLNSARDIDARSRVMAWTVTNPAGFAAADTFRLGTLKKGWRLLGMRVTAPATFSAATGTISIGVTGTVAKYMAATDSAAALSADGAHTDALFHGEVLAADTELIATAGTAGAGAGVAGSLRVFVRYSRD